tara:strand:+ start:96 stop:371 length:276 start_codon:yes stop_codon:yes gene_type:complete
MKLDDVLKIDTTEELSITIDGEEHVKTLYEVARWHSLIRGLEFINTKGAQLKINLDKDGSWVKPLALQKFIDEDTPSCVAEVKVLVDKERE